MRLFLSYAGEHRDTADAINLRLQQAGHDVFFDKDDLPPGVSYDDRIRRALEDSDGLVFLVAPESVEPGAYTLTELALARERWSDPSGRVLPVMVAPTPYGDIPEYLKAVTVLEPHGNVVAETVAAAERLTRRPWLGRGAIAAVGAILALAAGYAAWRAVGPGPGETRYARGVLSDLTTNGPIGGAEIEVLCGADAVAAGASDTAGRFDLAFGRCGSSATLSVKHESYAARSLPVPAGGAEVALALLPKELGGCVLQSSQGIVVGRFDLPIANAGDGAALSGRIARALTYDVLPVLQELNLPPEVQPRFVACSEASPRAVESAASYARALGADALLLGVVAPAGGAYDVTAYVGDAFHLFRPPRPSKTSAVALDDPAAAHLAPEMHGAILAAVARGYAERKMFPECVDVAVAAQGLIRSDALDETLATCQDGTGIAALRGGG